MFLLSLIGWSVIPFPFKSVLDDYVLIPHFDLPTVYKFESIFDQIKNICGHLGMEEELNSLSLVEDSDLRDPTKLEEKNQDLLDKKVLKEEKYRKMVKQLKKNNPDLLITEELVTNTLFTSKRMYASSKMDET